MPTFLYTAEPELENPGRFLARSLRDLAACASPAWSLFLSNLRADHRRSWLGYLWLVIPAAGLAMVCTFLLSQRVVAIRATELAYPVFVLSGMVLWQGFVDGLNAPLGQLKRLRQLITRSTVSHEAVIAVGVLNAILNASVRLCALAIVIAAFRVPLAASVVLFPLGLFVLIALGLAIGLLVAPLGLLYEDVSAALFLAIGILFFITPVAYPLPAAGLFRLNPVASLVSTARGWLTGDGGGGAFLAISVAALALLVLAWLLYRLARPHVVARLG